MPEGTGRPRPSPPPRNAREESPFSFASAAPAAPTRTGNEAGGLPGVSVPCPGGSGLLDPGALAAARRTPLLSLTFVGLSSFRYAARHIAARPQARLKTNFPIVALRRKYEFAHPQ